ncbi:Pectate lyase superfamily protein [compost metagenome]
MSRLWRRRVFYFSVLSILVLPFQNCTQSFVPGGVESAASSEFPGFSGVNTHVMPSLRLQASDYGALGDGVTDSTSAIQRAINAAIQMNSPTEIYFPAGTFYLQCSTLDWGSCLQIIEGKNITFRGAGKDLTRFMIGNRTAGFITVVRSSNISVQDFMIDFSDLPYTQGTVTQVNSAQNTIDVAVDTGYPRMDANVFDANSLANSFALNFDPNTTNLKVGVPHAYYPVSYTPIDSVSSRARLTSVSGFAPGDRFVGLLRKNNLLNFLNSRDLQLSKVKVSMSAGLVTAWVGNSGTIDINGLEVRRIPGRLLSATADAIHMVDTNAKVSIQNCYIEGMADDAINTRSTAFTVASAPSSQVVVFNGEGNTQFALGQTLQVVSPSTQMWKGSARITTLSHKNGLITASLDQAIPGVSAGDYVFNADFAAPNLLVKNNYFSYFRGIFRIRSPGAVFTGNQIVDAENAKVLISADIAPLWKEGPSLVGSNLNGVYFHNNTVSGGQFHLLGLNYADTGAPPLMGDDAIRSHPLVFDPAFYRTTNSDLANYSDGALKSHWLNHGIQEGRRGSVHFKAAEYLSLYSDLSSAFGGNYNSAVRHFVQLGATAERRNGSYFGSDKVFNTAVYRALNPDIEGMSVAQLQAHWIKNGAYEGRRASLQFSSKEYLQLHLDIRSAYGSTNYPMALEHYVRTGSGSERREGSIVTHPRVFNLATYLAMNADIANSPDEVSAGRHWILHGAREGRQASTQFSSTYYLAHHSDLLSSFGNQGYFSALFHYVTSGITEGRQGIGP